MSENIIEKCRTFLRKSSNYYSELVERKRRDLEVFSGNYWSKDLIDSTDRTGRICRSFSQYAKYANAIVSPFSKSPYHCDIEDKDGLYSEIQSIIDEIENDNNSKFVFNKTLRSAAIQGVGYFIISFDNGKIIPEAVRDVSQVAMDPSCYELDGSDAEAGAIVNYIPISKAKRLYGDDVINSNGTYALSDFGDQWQVPQDNMPIITYYEINDKGTVDMYTLCGNLNVTNVDDETLNYLELNISRIPIFRICFNEVVRNNKVDYSGIVDMTSDLQFGMNLGYSTLLERANRSPKANYMMPAKAIDGLEDFYKKLHTKESLVCLYNGDVAPTPIIEQYQTQDLMNTIETCNSLIAATIGIPTQGINPAMNSQTATEILIQQNNSESNVNVLYDNANQTIFSMTKTILEILCWQRGIQKLPTFKLINGPEIITKMMKRRQELLAISSLVDERTKKIIAKSYIDTLDAELKEPLLADIVANSPDIMFVSDSNKDEDPQAIATLQRMNAVLNETQDELEKQVAANSELRQEIQNLQIQLMNQKEQHVMEMIKHNDEMQLKQQELQLEAAKNSIDSQTKLAETDAKMQIENAKMQKELVNLEKAKMNLVNEAMNG